MFAAWTRRCGRLFAWALAAWIFSAGPAAARTFITLNPHPGAMGSQVFGINNAGHVVGMSVISAEIQRAFLYADGVFTELHGPEGAFSVSALGIADDGTIVGTFSDRHVLDVDMLFPNVRGFIYRQGVYTTFDRPSGWQTYFRGISPNGRYVTGHDMEGTFVLDTQTMKVHAVPQATDAFAPTLVQGVTDQGLVAGSELHRYGPNGSEPAYAFILDLATGQRSDVRFDGVTRTAFRDIGSDGQRSGWVRYADDTPRGFIGHPGAYEFIDIPGTDGNTVQSHNDSGWFVGNYFVDGTQYGFLATPVPEPQTWALMLAGIGLVAVARRRRSPRRPQP